MAFILLLLSVLHAGCPASHSRSRAPGEKQHRIYTTNFNFQEYPVSDNGNWINGKADGIDWSDVSAEKGIAIGHQKGDVRYVDGTALLTGKWGPDQKARATVYVGNTYPEDYPEVELRLWSSLSARHCSGYEIAFSAAGRTDRAYLIIVRWNGPVGDFTYIKDLKGPQYGVKNGDVIEARITGSAITAYLNGIEIASATDSVYTEGNPGMGFNFDWVDHGRPTGTNSSYGFTDFFATDDITVIR